MTSGTVLGMIRHRIAAIAATIIALSGIVGIGIAYAAHASSTSLVPNSGGQLTGTVYECVSAAHEGTFYAELHNPAPGNCAAGYLQFTANQPAASSTPSAPGPAVNSESFAEVTVLGPDTFKVNLPAGSHITGTVAAVDLDQTTVKPDAVTVTSVDNVTGAVSVTYAAGTVGHTIQITYDYQL